MVGAAIHEAYAPTMPGRTLGYMVNLIAEDSGHNSGNTLGAVVNWALGRFFIRFRDHRWFPVKEAELERATNGFNRYGSWSLLLAWVPVVGDPLTLVAGILRVPLMTFLVLVAIGKTVRYAAVIGIIDLF